MRKLDFVNKVVGYILWRFGYFQYRLRVVSDNPANESVKGDSIYVVGGTYYAKWAYLKCPDGCGDTIMLSLSDSKKPSWSISQDDFGRPTLYPSIHKLDGCKSHFWIRDGKVIWV